MFFLLSKLFWLVFRPLNLLIWLLVFSWLAKMLGQVRIARTMSVTAVFLLILLGFTQFANMPLGWLENRYKVPQISEAPYGIIILGGGLAISRVDPKSPYHIFEAAERTIKGFALKRRFPSSRLIYTGGDSSISQWDLPETVAAIALGKDIYGDNFSMETESKSRTTWENAVNVAAMLTPEERSRTWLLVTSASHMTRAMGSFQAAGMNPVAYPTDFRAGSLRFPFLTARATAQFDSLEVFTKEILGILAYWATGRFAAQPDGSGL